MILGLELDCPISHAVPPDEERRRAADNAAASGVELGRSLLILNHATTSRPLPVEVYAGVVERFPGPVFTDVTMEGGALIPGTRPISIPLAQMIPLAELFGGVLALRSGIVDMLSDAKVDLYSIYPRPQDAQSWVLDQAAWVNAYKNCTLEKIGLVGNASERPILLQPDDGVAEIAARIVARFEACAAIPKG